MYRVSNLVEAEEIHFTAREVRFFNFLMGRPVLPISNYAMFQYAFGDSTDFKDYVTMLQAVFTSFKWSNNQVSRERFFGVLETCLSFSPSVGIQLVRTDDSILLYPKGAELLDVELVNQTLAWLASHPKVLEPFEAALKLYMEGDKAKQRNLLDNLRFAIEQLLKEVLRNSKSLENQQGELGKWLKGKGVHQQVINLHNQLLFGNFRQYQNDAVKHAGEYQEQDIEFMIYLTGTFMRLLLQLEKST